MGSRWQRKGVLIMPRKARLLSSYPRQFFSLFEEALTHPLRVTLPSFKDAQRYAAELNQLRVALRSNLHPFYEQAEKVIISSWQDQGGGGGVLYARSQEAEYGELDSYFGESSRTFGEIMVKKLQHEQEELERAALGAPKPDAFDEAMSMLAKKEE